MPETAAPTVDNPPAPPQPSTVDDLAARVKEKYPDLADKPNADLVDRYLQKHPEYVSRIHPDEYAQLPSQVAARHQRGMTPENRSFAATPPTSVEQQPPGVLDVVKGAITGAGTLAKDLVTPVTKDPLELNKPFTVHFPAVYRKDIQPAMTAEAERAKKIEAENPSGAFWPSTEATATRVASKIPVVGPIAAEAGRGIGQGLGDIFAPGVSSEPWNEQLARSGQGFNELGGGLLNAFFATEGGKQAAKGIRKAGEVGAELTAPARTATGEALARPTLARPLSKKIAEDKYGHSPERAVVREDVSTSGQARLKMSQVGEALSDELNKFSGSQYNVDVDSIVDRNANAFIKEAERAGNPNVVARIKQIQDAMINEYGTLQKSPRAAAAMKSKLYGDVKWRGQDEVEATGDNFRKAVARDIREEINSKTGSDKIRQLNQRYGDLASAEETMYRQEIARSDKGIIERAKTRVGESVVRGTAQAVGRQYEPLPPATGQPGAAAAAGAAPGGPGGAPNAPQIPQPGAGGAGPGAAAAPALPTPPPAQLPPAPVPRISGQAAPALPGSEFGPPPEPALQSEAGPSGKSLVTPPPGTRIPAGETPLITPEPIAAQIPKMEAELGQLQDQIVRESAKDPETLQKARELQDRLDAARAQVPPAEQAPPAAAHPQEGTRTKAGKVPRETTEVDDRGRMVQLDKQLRTLNDQIGRSRVWTRAHQLIQKARGVSEELTALKTKYGLIKPEAEEETQPETRTGQVTPEAPGQARVMSSAEAAAPKFASRGREEIATKESSNEERIQALRTDSLDLEKKLRSNEGTAEERTAAESRLAQNREMIADLEKPEEKPAETEKRARKPSILKETYRSLKGSDKDAVDEAISYYRDADYHGRDEYDSAYKLHRADWRGLPIEEKFARVWKQEEPQLREAVAANKDRILDLAEKLKDENAAVSNELRKLGNGEIPHFLSVRDLTNMLERYTQDANESATLRNAIGELSEEPEREASREGNQADLGAGFAPSENATPAEVTKPEAPPPTAFKGNKAMKYAGGTIVQYEKERFRVNYQGRQIAVVSNVADGQKAIDRIRTALP